MPKVSTQEGAELGIQPRFHGSSTNTPGHFAHLLSNNSSLSQMVFRLCTTKLQVSHHLDIANVHLYHNFPAEGSNVSCSNVSITGLSDRWFRREHPILIYLKGLSSQWLFIIYTCKYRSCIFIQNVYSYSRYWKEDAFPMQVGYNATASLDNSVCNVILINWLFIQLYSQS